MNPATTETTVSLATAEAPDDAALGDSVAIADEPDALKPTVAWTYGLFRSCGTRSSHARFRPLYVTHACLPVLVL